MKNSTNITKYRFLSPIYDLVFRNVFIKARDKAFTTLSIRPNSKVLLVGIGTGEDLLFMPEDCFITGIDISEPMLRHAGKKTQNKNVEFLVMNAESLDFLNKTFDYVILNLVLSVVENPRQAMSEAVRVLKDNGKILVFDKFVNSSNVTLVRKLFNVLTSFIGTDINRYFDDIVRDIPVKIIRENASLFKGTYKIILLEKA